MGCVPSKHLADSGEPDRAGEGVERSTTASTIASTAAYTTIAVRDRPGGEVAGRQQQQEEKKKLPSGEYM
jgi:hypothetical protein